MSKLLRLLAIALFLIATFAFASTNDNGGYMGDGGGPIQTCRPGADCLP
jgi:hypothetical protein